MPKILITGTNGLLGQHLIRLFQNDKRWQIVAAARGENRLKNKEGYLYRSIDICEDRSVKKLFDEVKPAVVIHAAAMTQVDDCEKDKDRCWKTNVRATQYLIEAARRQRAFFVLISTDFIFDGGDGPYDETALPNPISFYGLSKLAAEMLLKGSELDFSILRTVLVYGVAEDPGRSNIVLWVKKSLESGKHIQVVDDQWRTPTLVQDLARGCKLVVDKKWSGEEPVSEVYNISGKALLTPYQMALKIAAYFDLDASLITRADATTFSQVAKRPARTGFILDRAEKELHYHPHSFEEGLEIVDRDLAGI